MRKFYDYELPVSRHSVDQVKDFIVLEKDDNYTWSGKTGGGMLGENNYIMWLVGYIIVDNEPCFYAMNFTASDFERYSQVRYDLVREILKKLKLYPVQGTKF
jgi:beta-lactamase class D